jgi:sulfate adenylyltransferase subunit 2
MDERMVNHSIFVLRETKAQFKNPAVMWSTGKDSTVMLHLCRQAFFGAVPFPVIHIDTGWKFPEIYAFRDFVTKTWNLDLRVIRSPLAGSVSPTSGMKRSDCCQELKTNALRRYIDAEGIDGLIVSIRRDEHYVRNAERLVSPRDKDMHWKFIQEKQAGEAGDSPFISLQDVVLWEHVEHEWGENYHHARIHPYLVSPPWSESDVWQYIKEHDVPWNPLYRSDYVSRSYPQWDGMRFRSLGCEPCTSPVFSKASTVDEILRELDETTVPERDGRAQDKESEQVMRKLRALGYF